ncbi:parathyroid hormone 4 [Anguilla anguilla]|uniref:parathyroid hormone 4 n=1 Tax=Anguilla anguilla TaxID=7936 RepID=UPI0015AD4B90|nr:parathyroid hormone 4 [Anguilla anguilla]
MLVSQKHLQSMAVMVIIIFSFAWCQENERRAVTEHQLMHDRGRAMQSLKRLMWLSNTMEGLHTAQARTPELDSDPPTDCRAQATQEVLSQLERGAKSSTLGSLLQVLWCSVRKPHLTGLPASEK